MKLFITGGAGFIGSNFIKYILKKHPAWQVVNLDKLTYAGNLENLREVENSANYKFLKGDIANPLDVEKAIDGGVDKIINYAAESHVDRSILDPEAFIRTDIFGAIPYWKRQKNIKSHNNGSATKLGVVAEPAKIVQRVLRKHRTIFAYKAHFFRASADLLCHAYFTTYNLPVIVTHSCNVFGLNAHPEKMIPLFITNLLEGKKVPVYGFGKQMREWIFAKDHCRAIELIMEKGQAGQVYNIGTGYEKQNIETVRFILKELGFGKEMIEYVKDRPGHDFRYSINCKKLRKLGWKPEQSWEQGLRRTISWYKENKEWWQKIKSGEFLKYYKKQYQTR